MIRKTVLAVLMMALAWPAAAEEKPLSVEQRLARLERLLESRILAEMSQDLEQLKTELRALRGDVERQGHEVQAMRKRQRELYLDSDRRLRDLELGAPQAGAPVASQPAMVAGETAAAVAVPSAAATPPGAYVAEPTAQAAAAGDNSQSRQKQEYQQAFEMLQGGRYESAIQAFEAFLAAYPAGPYADNARYWLGEANYVTRRFSAALSQFEKVVSDFPNSPKVADARLKIAYTYYEMKEMERSEQLLQQLIQEAPSASVARLAEQRLLMIREEGH